jgi:hypothetical protein
MLQVIPGVAFSVSQPVEHPLRRFPADLSVRAQVPHCIPGFFEFVDDFPDQGLLALTFWLMLSSLTRNIHPEFQSLRYPHFDFSS